ncbi:hypothetical protein AVEN_175452-1, partial [Araneus ventricosus]
ASLYYGRDFLGNGVLINSTVVLTSTSVVRPWYVSIQQLSVGALQELTAV